MSVDAVAMRPEIAQRVRKFVLALHSSEHAKHVLAVIVAGSAARGEEIWREGRLLSDIDLMLVTRHTSPYRTRALNTMIGRFRAEGIDGGPTPLPSLQRYRTFAFYEARAYGTVVSGEYDLDSLLPPMSPADIPRWEAIRVLANRMFEHLKLACGNRTAEQVMAKSYESLAEAGLGLEGRYRPSYRGRLAELEMKPPWLLGSDTCTASIDVLRARIENRPLVQAPSIDNARLDLLTGLHDALCSYLQAEGTIADLLGLLGRRECHWRHRVYWAIARPKHAADFVRVDPSIALWQKAAAMLQAPSRPSDAEQLVAAWKACPSILRHHDPRYAQ